MPGSFGGFLGCFPLAHHNERKDRWARKQPGKQRVLGRIFFLLFLSTGLSHPTVVALKAKRNRGERPVDERKRKKILIREFIN
jgi:hypothetical protein